MRGLITLELCYTSLENKMKRIFKLLAIFICIIALGSTRAFADTFNDLPSSHWAYEAVEFLYDQGVVVGYPDGSFKADNLVTRAEFSSMVVSALRLREKGVEAAKEFKDVAQGYWAYNDIRLASFFDLVVGTPDGYFYPYNNVSRVEVISIVMNSLSTDEMSENQAREILAKYPDANEVPLWGLLKTAKAVELGLMYNTPGHEHTLEPNRSATRGEVAMFIYNMMDQVKIRPSKKLASKPVVKDGYVIENAYFDADEAIIPAGTILPLGVMECIDVQKAKVGDPFVARALVNFVNKDKILLIPIGKQFSGKIVQVKKPLRFIRNSYIVLQTEAILDKDGIVEGPAFATLGKKAPDVRVIRNCPHLTRIRYYGTKTQRMFIHKSQRVEFVLMEPLRVKVMDNWIAK